jgi:hypothetical protein
VARWFTGGNREGGELALMDAGLYSHTIQFAQGKKP